MYILFVYLENILFNWLCSLSKHNATRHLWTNVKNRIWGSRTQGHMKEKVLLPQSQEKWSLSLHQCSETGMTKIKGMGNSTKSKTSIPYLLLPSAYQDTTWVEVGGQTPCCSPVIYSHEHKHTQKWKQILKMHPIKVITGYK